MHGNCKLTDFEVLVIRGLYEGYPEEHIKGWTFADIASEFNVSPITVFVICKHTTRKNASL